MKEPSNGGFFRSEPLVYPQLMGFLTHEANCNLHMEILS
jgi:hypothetical protein